MWFFSFIGLNYENKVDEEDTEDTKILYAGGDGDTMIMWKTSRIAPLQVSL
jgi:hypothetical protein